jgi:ABC transporter substrate binding protein (PQQ-dependent alcohol dehydrogenase system)
MNKAPMTPRDYAAWVAVRTLGEAATRTGSNTPPAILEFVLSPAFALAAFKGGAVSYRPWNGQLRQPVLIVGPRMLVSVSPQKGFLHPVSSLDSLGYDEPETVCKF